MKKLNFDTRCNIWRLNIRGNSDEFAINGRRNDIRRFSIRKVMETR